ncbi:OprD family outer membrane porin [Pantoea sp. RRHST58]|uniref:OprD family outer membrane porin n=1 Tax=Pantoea sp. RRHST58 TaxID=3425183 RepID=UPI003DA06D98
MKRKEYFLLMIPFFLQSSLLQANNNQAPFSVSENSLMRDSQLDLRLRNQWKYLKENEAQPTAVHNAWGQAASLDFRSGYLGGWLGFDATYTRAIRLAASDYFATRGLLYDSGGDRRKAEAHGFSKFGQRYLKIKQGDKKRGVEAKAGWQELKNVGVLTTTDRLSRNSYFGYSGALNWLDIRLDMAYVTKGIRHDSPHSLALQTQDNQRIAAIYTGALSYKGERGRLAYAFGEAEAYQRRHVIEASYALSPHLRFSSQIYGSQGLEKYKRMSASKRSFDEHAWHYLGEAEWRQGDWTQKFAAAWTSASKKDATGYYARPLTKNTRGRFISLTSAGKDYTRDKELALVSFTQYEIFKGVYSGVQINYGQFGYRNNRVRTGEVSFINRVVEPVPSLKNLSVFTLFGYGWSYKNNKETPLLDAHGKYMRSHNLSGEIAIEYKFNLLR